MRGAAGPDQAVDLRVGGDQKLAQQGNPEEAGRPGEQYLSRSFPAWWRTCVQVDRIYQFGFAGEVDARIRTISGKPSRAGILRGLREPQQCRVAEQTAG